MLELDDTARRELSRSAATHYEANLFAQNNPDYFQCPENTEAMIGYLRTHKLSTTYDNFVIAYKALTKQHRIIPAAEAVSRMRPEDFKRMAEKCGTPVKNYAGQVVGYDLPPLTTKNWTAGAQRITSRGIEGMEYQRWCVENGFDADTGEKLK